ncbi:hypothetical protein Tco_1513980 [Tanacetum coccineum]
MTCTSRRGHSPLSSIFASQERLQYLKDRGLRCCRSCGVLSTRQISIMLKGYGKNLLSSKHKFHKRPGSPLHMPYEESALGYLKFSFKNTKRVRFVMAIPDTLISENIRSATYYPEYVAKVVKYQRYLAGEVVSDDEAPATKPAKGAKPKTTRKPKPQSPKTVLVAKPATSKISKSTSS